MNKFMPRMFSVTLILALLLSNVSTIPAFAAPEDDLVITGVVDGPLTGGVPKAVELYAVNAIADLSIYGLGSANNGGGTDGEEFSFPAVSVPAGTCIYVASESTGFNTFFGFNPDYTSGAVSINGDDAIELFANGSVSDVFGEITHSGAGAWGYEDGWAYRQSATGPDGSTFVIGNWTFSGPNALDGETSNASAGTPFPLSTYSPCASSESAPTVSSTTPANAGTNVAVDADIDITFSEAVNVSSSWFDISCGTSGAHTATVSGGPTAFTLDPDTDFSNSETCVVTVFAAQVTDQDSDDPPDTMSANYVFSFDTVDPAPVIAIVINEILADPASDLTGDANGDGTVVTTDDEFVEIVNNELTSLNISGWTLSDALGVKHTFPANTVIPASCSIVVFAAGTPTGTFGRSLVQVASTGQLGLNNTGDTVTLNNGTSNVASYTYAAEGNDNQSLTRDPDITGADPLVKHSTATGSGGSLFSPGTKVDGSQFAGCPVEKKVHDIQGATHISPLNGQTVNNVPGIVTALASNGFYLQDPNPDADDKTSEGIFVFTNSAPTVAVGDSVQVTGVVTEFRPGGNPNNLTITEITSPTISVVSSGNPLPTPIVLGNGGRTIPTAVIENDASNVEAGGIFDPTEDGIDFYESLEGMRVQINNPVTTSPTGNFGISEEIWVLADNGTNATSRTSRGGSLITSSDFNPERIQIDDLINASVTLPTVDVGAQLSTITGVVNYDFSNYEVLVSSAPFVVTASTLTKEVTTLTGTADQLTVSTFNVENLDPGDGAAQFNGLAVAIVDNLKSPDILNLEEVQDNNGPTNDSVVAANVTLQTLIDAIVAAGGPTYEFRQIDPVDDTNGGEPGGNIRVGFLFNPARVSFVDRPGGTSTASTTVTNNAGIPTLSFSPGLIDPANSAFNSSRKPIVGEFLFNGQTVYVIGNHFSSKGGDQPLFGPNQPPTLNSEVARNQQATIVSNFVQSILAIDPNANVIVAGDLNDFEFSNPLTILENGGLNTLVETLPPNERYSYNFEGNAQVLDHILVSDHLLANLDGFDVVHINSEFDDQVSDHDPVIARLNVTPPTYTLQLLHYYGESGLLGVETGPIMGAMIDKFDDQYNNTLVLGEGDSFIPGPWLVGGADPSLNSVPDIGSTALGRPDIAIMNAFGTDVSALGNHEFDLGSPVLQSAIQNSGSWVGAQFPLITANLDFTADSALKPLADASLGGNAANTFAGQEASAIKGKIAPYAVVTTPDGEKIGLVGATTYELLIKTSPNGTVPKDDGNLATDDLQEVAIYLQAAVDALNTMDVDKIIMVDQLDTIERNKLLAPMVSGIDVMIAGGGHERMGDATDTPVGFNGHSADFIADAYPIVTTGLDGKPVLIVTTDTEYTYLGRLVLDFDANGEIILSSLDPAINGAYASTEANLQAAYGTTDSAATIVAGSTIGSKVNAITQAINTVISAKDGTIWGYTDVYIEGDRAFGRAQEVNLGDFTADANIYAVQLALPGIDYITSLKNGGGLRASIGSIDEDGTKIPPIANPLVGKPAGAISTLDIENALRFNNRLMVFDTTPQGLKIILEHAASLTSGPPQQNGGFMQIGGMRVSYDTSSPTGSRIRSIALTDRDGNFLAGVYQNGAFTPDAPATITMVSLNFTANGGDGYPIKANADNFRYLLTDGTLSAPIDESLDFTAAANVPANALGEQKAFQDYLQEFYDTPANAFDQADTPVELDQRIQILPFKPVDTVFPPDVAIDQEAGQADPTATSPINFTVVFSRAVTGFDGSDVDLSGTANPTTAVVTEVAPNNGTTYNVAVSGMTASGTVVASVPVDVVDGGNRASTSTDNTVNFIFVIPAPTCNGQSATIYVNAQGKIVGGPQNGQTYSGTLIGTSGLDVIVGTNSADAILALGGNDVVCSLNGNDIVLGGNGLDWIDAGTGLDLVDGGFDADILFGGDNNDLILGGPGADSLNGGNGTDSCLGGIGTDTSSACEIKSSIP